jgi:hypothetical protein
MDIRGVYRFRSLVKQNKKAKICFVIHIAGGKKILFYNFIYFVIVKQKILNGPLITTCGRRWELAGSGCKPEYVLTRFSSCVLLRRHATTTLRRCHSASSRCCRRHSCSRSYRSCSRRSRRSRLRRSLSRLQRHLPSTFYRSVRRDYD